MARVDAIVLGAGIVGTSVGLHLAKRGLAVALVDRRAPGEETSYGNAGIIEGNTVFPVAFPRDPKALLRIALKRAPDANYHLAFLPRVAPWLFDFYIWSAPARLAETARLMRPLFAKAVAEHEALMAESGAARYLRKNGWLKVYRSDAAFAATEDERALATTFGLPVRELDVDAARALEPSLAPVFRRATFWGGAASVSDPLSVTPKRCIAQTAVGASTPARVRSMPTWPSSRSDRGRRMCWRRLASTCQSASSAVITGISARSSTRRSRVRWSMSRTAIAWRRWSRACDSPRGPSSPRATRR